MATDYAVPTGTPARLLTERRTFPRIAVGQLAWRHAALGAVLLVAAALNLWGLAREGYANTYYAAAVKSMLTSWHNFFYLSFDSGGFVSAIRDLLGQVVGQLLEHRLLPLEQLLERLSEGVLVIEPVLVRQATSANATCHVLDLPPAFHVAGILSQTSVWVSGTGPLPPRKWSGRGRRPKLVRRDDKHQPASVKELALANC